MQKLRELYNKNQKESLLEARVALLQNEIYPFDIFLKEKKETVRAAEQIEKLEEMVGYYKNVAPALYLFVKNSTDLLMESTINTNAVEAAMINYSFITEAIGKYVAKAVELIKTQQSKKVSLTSVYGIDAVKLLEFSMKKSDKYRLMKGNKDQVINMISRELANLPISNLSYLCENIKPFRLYVSNSVHSKLAKVIVG